MKPWERYGNQQAQASPGPWARYAEPAAQAESEIAPAPKLSPSAQGFLELVNQLRGKPLNVMPANSENESLIGLGRGFTDVGEGVKQAAMEVGTRTGQVTPEELQQFNADATAERDFYAGTPVGQSTTGGTGRIVGNILPMAAAVPAGLGASVLVGAAQGATQFADSPEDRLKNTAIGAAIPAAIRGTGAAIQGAVRGMVRGGEKGRQVLSESIDTFADAGASPTIGQGTQRRAILGFEKIMKSMPGGGGTIERAAEKTANALGERATALADSLKRGATAESAGRAVQKGLAGFADRFRAKGSTLFDEVDNFVPATQTVPISATLAKVRSLTTPTPGATAVSAVIDNPKLKQIAEALEADAATGQIPYGALKELRTKIGGMISRPELVSDVPRGELKQLYGALTDDMRGAAQASGPQALKAFERANSYWKAGSQRIDDFLDRLNKKVNPEDVYKAVTSGREGATVMRTIKKSLTGDEWREVSAAALKRMGRATPSNQNELGEVFSAETFLTNWNRLAPEARAALFAGPHAGATADGVNKLAKAAAMVRESNQVLKNMSGTSPLAANVAATAATVTAGALGNAMIPGAVIATALLNRLGAAAVTNPGIVRWMAMATTVPANSLPKHILSLSSVAASVDPEVQDEIAGFLRDVSKASQEVQPENTSQTAEQ